MEIDENIITTEIDKLLELVSERGQVSVEKASEELGIPNDRIKTWAEALEEDGLIERVYSARKGTVLKKKKKEEAEKEIYKFKEEVEEELGDIIEIVKKREGLKELEKDLKNIKNTLEDCEGFKDEKTLDEIVKIVQKDEKELKSKEAEEAIVNVLEGVEKE
ncbi:MAG: hypothetical protein MUP58_02095, partial [Candidatus Nanohaloarchaeota archaeon QJJ-9]|nr:hypothetical protein [Candidatus Nanohaloarchaeota archaeon QJJ-9]